MMIMNILILNFLVFLHVSNPKVRLQEDGCIYRYDIEHTLLPTRLLILMHVKYTTPYHKCIYNRLPEDEPSGSKHVEDIRKLRIKILM